MGHWQEIDHTADIALRVWGDDLGDLFITAARGMFALVVEGLADVAPERAFPLALDAPDVETLLVDWLNEVLYLQEVEKVAFVAFDFETLTPITLRAQVRGGAFPAYRAYIKAATYHNLAVVATPEGYQVEIVLDT